MSDITVVVTTRNRASMLAVALESVLASPLIDSPHDVVVVDDDSSDNTPSIVEGFGTQYVRVTHHSMSLSKNAGLALAATPYVTFLDDDDAWLPGNMELQLAALEEGPELAFAYGQSQVASDDLEPLPATWPTPPLVTGRGPSLLHIGYPQLGVVLFRRDALNEVGAFDPAIPYFQDAELMLRIAARHPIAGMERVGMLYRTRAPSRARADYFWSVRGVTRWTPRGRHVSVRSLLRFQMRTRGLFMYRLFEDAAVCSARGDRGDALVCVARGVWIAPLHALRHPRVIARALLQPRRFFFHSTAAPWQRANDPSYGRFAGRSELP